MKLKNIFMKNSENLGEIFIPHLNYLIKVKDLSKPEGAVISYKSSRNLKGCTHSINNTEGHIYINFPIKIEHHGAIGHEIIHLLEYIAEWRDIDFKIEREHFAYMFEFIFNSIVNIK